MRLPVGDPQGVLADGGRSTRGPVPGKAEWLSSRRAPGSYVEEYGPRPAVRDPRTTSSRSSAARNGLPRRCQGFAPMKGEAACDGQGLRLRPGCVGCSVSPRYATLKGVTYRGDDFPVLPQQVQRSTRHRGPGLLRAEVVRGLTARNSLAPQRPVEPLVTPGRQ